MFIGTNTPAIKDVMKLPMRNYKYRKNTPNGVKVDAVFRDSKT